ncbi:MAG: nucleotidyltransferase domain-containing protein [Lachnospirales bacterium]
MYGLKESDVNYIIKQVQKIDDIEKVSIFGSRAKCTYRENSDIDIVVYGTNINKSLLYKLYELLEENAPYPFFVDIVHYESSDEILRKEVDLNSIVIYEGIN